MGYKDKAEGAEWRRQHYAIPEFKAKMKARNNKWRDNNPLQFRFSHIKMRAKQDKITLSLTFEEYVAIATNNCFYCGLQNQTFGIDRIDSSHGYEVNNCVSSCQPCNRMKQRTNQHDFLDRCSQVAKGLVQSKNRHLCELIASNHSK
jgi:hypothetical protein